jgi:TonB family C-terminal domain
MGKVTFEKDLLFAAMIALAIHAGIVFTHMPLITPHPLSFKTENYSHLEISMVTTDTVEVKKPSVAPLVKKVVRKERKIIKPDKRSRPISPKKEIMESLLPEKLEASSNAAPSIEATTPPPAAPARGGTEAAKVIIAVPRYNENTPPIYPSVARRRGYEGVVLISAEILVDGSVGELEIKRSSGHNILDRSALKAVKKWKFEPARRMGYPVTMCVDVPVRFVLNDTGGNQ